MKSKLFNYCPYSKLRLCEFAQFCAILKQQLLLTSLGFHANLNLNEMGKRDQKVSKTSCPGGIIGDNWNVKTLKKP